MTFTTAMSTFDIQPEGAFNAKAIRLTPILQFSEGDSLSIRYEITGLAVQQSNIRRKFLHIEAKYVTERWWMDYNNYRVRQQP